MNKSLRYFDAVFYIQKNDRSLPSCLFQEVLLASNNYSKESKSIIRKLTLTKNEIGEFDYKKARKIILNKSKREGFTKVLVINHLLENHPEEFSEHLNFMVEEMNSQKWNYWQIESLSNSVLTSTFKGNYLKESKVYFAYAFNLIKQ